MGPGVHVCTCEHECTHMLLHIKILYIASYAYTQLVPTYIAIAIARHSGTYTRGTEAHQCGLISYTSHAGMM